MKKIVYTLLLSLVAINCFGQWQQVGNTLQRTADGKKYRTNLGSPGFAHWYTLEQIDSLLALHPATVSATSPLSYNSGTGIFSIQQSSTTLDGYLSHTDWNTFNNKLSTTVAASTYVPYNGSTADIDLVTTHHGLYGEFIEVGHGSTGGAGVYGAVIYNVTPGANGALLLQGGDATHAAMNIEDNTGSATNYITFYGHGAARFAGADTAATFVKQGATAGNILLAGGSDIPQSTFAPAAQGISSASIAWTVLYNTPTTGVISGNALTFSPVLANQAAYSVLSNSGGSSGTPSFISTPSVNGLIFNGNQTANAWGLSGIRLNAIAATMADNSTTAGATVTNMAFNSIAASTITAANATSGSKVTYTNGYSFYIAGAPVLGANTLMTNPYAFGVGSGDVFFGGRLAIGPLSPTSQLSISNSGNATFDFRSTTGSTIMGMTTQLQQDWSWGVDRSDGGKLKFAPTFLALTSPVLTLIPGGGIIVSGHTTVEGVTSAGATGTQNIVYSNSPTLVTPNLGTPSALVGTNITGTAAALNIGGNAATVTNGVYKVASANLTGQTTVGNVLTYTTTATGTFEISSYLNITAISSESVTLQVTYTDENSNANTTTIPIVSQTNAVFSSSATVVGNRPALPITIRALTGTVITVLTITSGGGTVTFDAGATITQL